MDYMLRTNTKEEMDQALLDAGLVVEHNFYGTPELYAVSGVAVDHIGPVHKPAVVEEVDGEMMIITPGSVDNRWHTNIRVGIELTEEQIAALPQVDPPPAIPYRVFA